MLTYRKINAADVEQVAAFAIVGMRPQRYPLVMSNERIKATIKHFMNSATDYHLAAFDEAGRMVGGIALYVAQMPWFERAEAHIVMLFATVPGAGFRLMREAMRWVAQHMGIRRVLWPLEDDVTTVEAQRIERIAQRYGFNRRQTVMLAYKE